MDRYAFCTLISYQKLSKGDFTHVQIFAQYSSSGVAGSYTAIKHRSSLRKAYSAGWTRKLLAGDSVKQEAGSGFVFPEGEVPPALETSSPFGALKGTPIALEDFNKLTKIPIIIYYGDYIPLEPTDEWNKDNWRVRLIMARQWAEAVNRHGGNAVVVHLPEIGIKGNTHFLFADLNNVEIADHMENWLIANKLR